jgi:uncharacterized protein (TIGR02145 family)
MLRYFPEVPTDNHFTGIGLHGVFDSKFERVIITKLDYIPIDKDVKYDADKNEFYIETITYIDAATTTTSTSSTTTSTTTVCTSWEYSIDLIYCETCTLSGPAVITNSEPLTLYKYYYLNGFKIGIKEFLGCTNTVAENNILNSSQEDNCIDVLCPVTTTTTTTNCCTLPDVEIGTQIWTACNLDVDKYRDGTPIPQVTDPTQWANLTTGAWCYYNNADTNCYGKLYNWFAVNDPRGLAPAGYHIPSKAEWDTLEAFLPAPEGGSLKEVGTANWNPPNALATNSTGFTALPSGIRDEVGNFDWEGDYGNWWTTTASSSTNAWTYYTYTLGGGLPATTTRKVRGFAVRLIKD